MKPILYPNNGNGLYVQFFRVREGTNYFLIHYKDSAVLRRDPKDAWRVLGVAKFTDNGKNLKQWCLDTHEQYKKVELPDNGRKDTSFASEAMKEEEPNDNTKMVV